MKASVINYPVFRDIDGNRFILPSVYSSSNSDIGMSTSSLWTWCRRFEVALNVREEKYKFSAAVDSQGLMNFTRIVADVYGAGFAHGGSEVWIIGGPKFNEGLEKFVNGDGR